MDTVDSLIASRVSLTDQLNELDKYAVYRIEKINGVPSSVHVQMRPTDIEYDPTQRLTTELDMENLITQSKDGLLASALSPIERGDMRNSVITFLTACVGAGILSFPQIFSFYGIALSIVISFVFAYLNYETYYILDRTIQLSGRRGYGNICSYYFGERVARWCNVGMMSVLFVVAGIYASISWNFLEKLLNDNNIVNLPIKNVDTGEIDEYASKTIVVRTISLAIIAVLSFPLLMLRKLTALRFITAGIMLVIAYVFILAILQTPAYYRHHKDQPNYVVEMWPSMPNKDWIAGVGALSMSFSAQPVYIYIRSEIIHKSPKRTKGVYTIGLLIQFFLYTIFGLCGYISLGKNMVPKIFTQRNTIYQNDLLMALARWAFFPLIALHVLLPFITLRESIFQYFKMKRSPKNLFLLTGSLAVTIFALPVVYPDVLALMGLFGGLFSGFFACVVIFAIGYKISDTAFGKAKYVLFAMIFVASALANTYQGIVGVFVHGD